ncbi:MAG: HAD-IC family P-type ATPase [Thermoplasmata archaeon]|nr:MAG: HAD-IC family P-type ATPase [Thermoplasmata archaeon]
MANPQKPYLMSLPKLFKSYETTENGLTTAEALQRLKEDGPNLLYREKKRHPFLKFLDQFYNILIIILLFTAILCFFIPIHFTDGFVILIVVFANAIIGYVQEYRAEKAIFSLKRLSASIAMGNRDGELKKVSSADLVHGDIIQLSPGHKVPADCRLFDIDRLEINESVLTGESLPAEKDNELIKKDVSLAERKNMAYMGTIITRGEGNAVVVATGMKTELGHITKLVLQEEEKRAPLQIQLDRLGRFLAVFAISVGILLFILVWAKADFSFLQKDLIEPALTSISLAVAVIPEGLPVVVALTLTLGMQIMARKNAIVRKLSSVETLGCTTIICTDKTGTLTKNEMTVEKIFTSGKVHDLSNSDIFSISSLALQKKGVLSKKYYDISYALKLGLLCNDSKIVESKKEETFLGSPTDNALVVAAQKAGFDFKKTYKQYERIEKIPFTSERKLMVTYHLDKDGPEHKILVIIKGAPEKIMDLSRNIMTPGKIVPFSDRKRKKVWMENEKLGAQAYRNIAVAFTKIDPEVLRKSLRTKKDSEGEAVSKFMSADLNFTFVGLFALWDPPRDEAFEAIKRCKSAGIKVVMITGDQTATAVSIAKKLKIYKKGNMILTGSDLEIMSPEKYSKIVDKVTVYTRVSPKHKMQIVEAFQKRGDTVAMTGDGINDAPALAKADIGVAMGKSGTDVARDSSNIILMDDNFSTIVTAIEEGRKIYNNIKRFVRYQISTNVGAIYLLSLAVMIGFPIPLFPVQILWINIIMDGPPAIALGMEPVTQNVMDDPPRSKKERILSTDLLLSIFILGLVMACGTLFLFNWSMNYVEHEDQLKYARTMAFTVFVIFQLFNVLNCKSQTDSIFSSEIFKNKFLIGAIIGCFFLQLMLLYVPPLQMLFHTIPLSWMDWILIICIALSILIVEEVIKVFKRTDIF